MCRRHPGRLCAIKAEINSNLKIIKDVLYMIIPALNKTSSKITVTLTPMMDICNLLTTASPYIPLCTCTTVGML